MPSSSPRSAQSRPFVEVRESEDGSAQLVVPALTWPVLDVEVLIGHLRAAAARHHAEESRRAVARTEVQGEPLREQLAYTLPQVAERLGLTYEQVRGLLARGELRRVHETRRPIMVRHAALVAYVEGRAQP